jgi:hypothetical protein
MNLELLLESIDDDLKRYAAAKAAIADLRAAGYLVGTGIYTHNSRGDLEEKVALNPDLSQEELERRFAKVLAASRRTVQGRQNGHAVENEA